MSTELPEELLGIDDVGFDEEGRDPEGDGDEEEEPEEQERVLVFRLGDRTFGLDVGDVRSIVEQGDLTRLPRSGDAIDGIMDLRGEITAVIDPRKLLPVPVADRETKQRVIVFDRSSDDQSAGIRVDAVEGVRSYPVSQIKRDDPAFEMPAGNLVKAVVEVPAEDESADEVAERTSIIDVDTLVRSAN
ncbi:chemotaxis protein CheW [Halostella salina]|uniref:chemotaxis protein CheW n=1 Tax=Halostella salina TaxID=1547897 RepID=UPI000EF77906|nr:chemotaxis protein CheW [Halostella salina]